MIKKRLPSEKDFRREAYLVSCKFRENGKCVMCMGGIMSEVRMVTTNWDMVEFSEVSACVFFHHPVENPVDTVHNS